MRPSASRRTLTYALLLVVGVTLGCRRRIYMTPLTLSGRDSEPAVSPDGRTLAFVSTRDGTPRIWIKPFTGGTEVALTDGPDHDPRFMPGGEGLLFVRGAGDSRSIQRLPISGGSPRALVGDAYQCDPAPDGDRIAFLRASSPRNSLWVARVDGSEPTLLYEEAEAVTLDDLRWSPDSRQIAVVARPATSSSSHRILLVDAATGEAAALLGVPPDAKLTALDWSGGGDELVYGYWVGSPETTRVVAHDLRAGTLRDLFWKGGAWGDPQIVLDGAVVLARDTQRQRVLRRISLGAGEGASDGVILAGPGSRPGIWSSEGREAYESVSGNGYLSLHKSPTASSFPFSVTRGALPWEGTRDGWIVYSASRSPHKGLYRIRGDGSEDTLIFPGNCSFPDVSPDGRYVLFLHQTGTADNLSGRAPGFQRVAEVVTGALMPFQIELPDDESSPANHPAARWVQDGSGVVFLGVADTGQWGLLVQDFIPGEDTRSTRRLIAPLNSELVIESFGLLLDDSGIVISGYDRVQMVVLAQGVPGVRRSGR